MTVAVKWMWHSTSDLVSKTATLTIDQNQYLVEFTRSHAMAAGFNHPRGLWPWQVSFSQTKTKDGNVKSGQEYSINGSGGASAVFRALIAMMREVRATNADCFVFDVVEPSRVSLYRALFNRHASHVQEQPLAAGFRFCVTVS